MFCGATVAEWAKGLGQEMRAVTSDTSVHRRRKKGSRFSLVTFFLQSLFLSLDVSHSCLFVVALVFHHATSLFLRPIGSVCPISELISLFSLFSILPCRRLDLPLFSLFFTLSFSLLSFPHPHFFHLYSVLSTDLEQGVLRKICMWRENGVDWRRHIGCIQNDCGARN